MNKYYFIDGRITASLYNKNVKLYSSEITKEEGVLFVEGYDHDKKLPWEVRYDNAYPTVIFDEQLQLYRCYYTLFIEDEISSQTKIEDRPRVKYTTRTKRMTALAYAESKDGINWDKPDLNIVDYKGSKKNNLLLKHAHGTGVFLDTLEKDPKKRYKLITKVDFSINNSYVAYAFSSDGIHFTEPKRWPKYNPEADSLNYVFYDDVNNDFKLITRIWADGIRVSALSKSTDFINWSEPTEIFRGDGYNSQVYSLPIFKIGELYFGFPSMFHAGDSTLENYDTVDVELVYSSDIVHWNRLFSNIPFIPRGTGTYGIDAKADSGCIFTSVPIEKDDILYFYYMGGNGKHTSFRETSLCRGFIHKDKLSYYSNRDESKESHLLTKNLTILGSELILLADIETDGYINVSLGDLNDNKLVGYETSTLEKVADHKYAIKFNTGILELEGKAVSVHIDFKKAKLYGIEGDIVRN